jgi:arylsulfatase A-like enzyme
MVEASWRSRTRVAALLIALGLAGGLVARAAWSPGASFAAPSQPNFVIVLVDDQALNSFKRKFMPQTFRWILDHGTRLTRGVAAPPLCCPDRAGILTGQYPHNNGVISNRPGYTELNDPEDTLPVWLRNAGYRTGFVGKFLNGYARSIGAAPAPGFDSWFAMQKPRYYHYRVSNQGTIRQFGSNRHEYATDVFTRQAKRFIHSSALGSDPFFLWLGYHAPHIGSEPAAGVCGHDDPTPPNRAGLRPFLHEKLPTGPSFNEADVSDKPPFVRGVPRLSPKTINSMRRRWRCTLAAMSSVDSGVGRVMRELRATHELDDTIVVYLSDNGFFFGEHRLDRGKSLPYEPSLRVPFAIRVPPAYRSAPRPHRLDQVIPEQDIAPTFLSFAGNPPSCMSPGHCRTIDGRSIRPLLNRSGSWPNGRGILAEITVPGLDYTALRSRRYLYVEYNPPQRELYDLRSDPHELQNVSGRPAYAVQEAKLALRLASLRSCSGTSGPNGCE